jgi:O-antigen/teichoic acid export membrane protein
MRLFVVILVGGVAGLIGWLGFLAGAMSTIGGTGDWSPTENLLFLGWMVVSIAIPIASWVGLYRWFRAAHHEAESYRASVVAIETSVVATESAEFVSCPRCDRTINASLPRCPYCGAKALTTS